MFSPKILLTVSKLYHHALFIQELINKYLRIHPAHFFRVHFRCLRWCILISLGHQHICFHRMSPSLVFPSVLVWIMNERISWPMTWSCVYNFFICQHLLIRGDPGAERKPGFDKGFASIMSLLIIYNILCAIHHAYSSKTLHHAPFSYACTILKLKRCLIHCY